SALYASIFPRAQAIAGRGPNSPATRLGASPPTSRRCRSWSASLTSRGRARCGGSHASFDNFPSIYRPRRWGRNNRMTYIVPEIALATRGDIVGILDLQERE